MGEGLAASVPGRLRVSQPLPLGRASHRVVASDTAGWLHRTIAEAVADDDARRTAAVVRLLGGAVSRTVGHGGAAADVPAALMQFWDTADVPRDVAECIASWERLVDDVPGLSRMMFDDKTAREFIGDELTLKHVAAFDACRHPAMRSDYFRLCFLLRHGGLYVDADELYLGGLGPELLTGLELKLQPLCYDVAADEMVDAEVFLEAVRSVSRREPVDDATNARDLTRTHYVNNNPLVAPSGHPLIQAALERATRLLAREATDVSRSLGVQSTTGPGNLTAALVTHAFELGLTGTRANVSFIENWDEFSVSRWPLEYRHDERNWRLWNANG